MKSLAAIVLVAVVLPVAGQHGAELNQAPPKADVFHFDVLSSTYRHLGKMVWGSGVGNFRLENAAQGVSFRYSGCIPFGAGKGYLAKWEDDTHLRLLVHVNGTDRYTPCILTAERKPFIYAVSGDQIVTQPMGRP